MTAKLLHSVLTNSPQARCPPRVAKAFRIVRVKDSRVPDSEARRDCQLNVTDVLKLGEDFLVEGKRYLVRHFRLIPLVLD